MALTGLQKTGPQPRAWPSEPQADFSESPPLTPRPAGLAMAFGQDDCGQLGLGIAEEEERILPTPVVLPPGKTIVDVAAGGLHSAFLTAEGEVLACGLNDEGELARPNAGEEDCRTVASVSLGPPMVAAQVSCGDSFTAVLDTLGRVFWAGQLSMHVTLYYTNKRRDSPSRGYAWGSGVSNQLCLGEEVQEVASPVPMVGLPGPLQTISVGGQHTLVLVDPPPAPSTSK
ncbi:PREDICTED: regulator of chromosome condensation-like [Branchiostoma belcheri]|uniref:Regulator of chromosome condensation-like n=1 Tax=Branchiostoma belcheri TaxID=7741 RepID=A0A6P5AVS8_BRABE|nr:PREDICTED: regulator of chromosome condensation-like [Branchiostoma belcheri]